MNHKNLTRLVRILESYYPEAKPAAKPADRFDHYLFNKTEYINDTIIFIATHLPPVSVNASTKEVMELDSIQDLLGELKIIKDLLQDLEDCIMFEEQ